MFYTTFFISVPTINSKPFSCAVYFWIYCAFVPTTENNTNLIQTPDCCKCCSFVLSAMKRNFLRRAIPAMTFHSFVLTPWWGACCHGRGFCGFWCCLRVLGFWKAFLALGSLRRSSHPRVLPCEPPATQNDAHTHTQVIVLLRLSVVAVFVCLCLCLWLCLWLCVCGCVCDGVFAVVCLWLRLWLCLWLCVCGCIFMAVCCWCPWLPTAIWRWLLKPAFADCNLELAAEVRYYPDLVQTDGQTDGRTDRRTVGRTEGWKDGRTEGRKEGGEDFRWWYVPLFCT